MGTLANPLPVVPPQLGNPTGARSIGSSRDQELQPTVAVIIRPGHRTFGNPRQTGNGHIGKRIGNRELGHETAGQCKRGNSRNQAMSFHRR